MEWIVITLLAAWFIVTLVYQLFLGRLIPVAARWDLFRVVPSWHLYTSLPKGRRLRFRDRDGAGHVGAWSDLPLRCCERAGHALFNPDLFAADAIASHLEGLAVNVQKNTLPSERLVKTVGWQGVWRGVANQPGMEAAVARQFEVREWELTDPAAEVSVYVSEFLPLRKADA